MKKIIDFICKPYRPLTSHHGCDLVERLQVSNYFGLVRWLDAGKAPGAFHRLSLLLGRQVVKLAARVRLPLHVLLLAEDADASADGHGRAFVVSRDHDDADAGLVAQLHRADHLLPGRVQHADAADERQAHLKGGRGERGEAERAFTVWTGNQMDE